MYNYEHQMLKGLTEWFDLGITSTFSLEFHLSKILITLHYPLNQKLYVPKQKTGYFDLMS